MLLMLRLMVFINYFTFSCSQSWSQYGSISYFAGTRRSTNEDATRKCAEAGGQLATVDTEDIQKFLSRIADDAINAVGRRRLFGFYIGLRRISNKSLAWFDGTLASETYTNWHQSEPNNQNRNENCVIMGWIYTYDKDYGWYDFDCERKAYYICEQRSVTTTTRAPNTDSSVKRSSSFVSKKPTDRGSSTKQPSNSTTNRHNNNKDSSTKALSTLATKMPTNTTNLSMNGSSDSAKADNMTIVNLLKGEEDEDNNMGLLFAAIGVPIFIIVGLAFAVLLWVKFDSSTEEDSEEGLSPRHRILRHPRRFIKKIPKGNLRKIARFKPPPVNAPVVVPGIQIELAGGQVLNLGNVIETARAANELSTQVQPRAIAKSSVSEPRVVNGSPTIHRTLSDEESLSSIESELYETSIQFSDTEVVSKMFFFTQSK